MLLAVVMDGGLVAKRGEELGAGGDSGLGLGERGDTGEAEEHLGGGPLTPTAYNFPIERVVENKLNRADGGGGQSIGDHMGIIKG